MNYACPYCYSEDEDIETCHRCKSPKLIEPKYRGISDKKYYATSPKAAGGGQSWTGKFWLFFIIFLFVGMYFSSSGEKSTSPSGGGESENYNSDEIDFDGSSLPILVGKNALKAWDFLSDKGYYLDVLSISGEDLEPKLNVNIGKGSWTTKLRDYFICDQNPLPGTPIDSNHGSFDSYIKVDKSCENKAPEFVSGKYRKELGVWGPEIVMDANGDINRDVFQGWVIAVEKSGILSGPKVRVRTPFGENSVELEGVTQFETLCPKKISSGSEMQMAFEEFSRDFPVNSRVQINVTNTFGGYVIATELKGENKLIKNIVPENTVNWALVKYGYWIPDSNAKFTSNVQNMLKSKWTYDPFTIDTEEEANFYKSLISSANLAISNSAGPYGICFGR